MTRVAVASAALLLAACRPAPAPVATDIAKPVIPAVAGRDAAPSRVAAAPRETTEAPQTRAVVLAATGIIVTDPAARRSPFAALEFGRDRAAVMAAMAGRFARTDLSRLDECGAGPMEFAAYGPLKLNFLDGKFVGWFAETGSDAVTVDGFTLGISLRDIRSERAATRIAASTLDGEFEYSSGDGNTIGGFLKGSGDGAVVTSLFAGVNCFFR